MNYQEEDFILLSGIQHFVFCKRQWCLIHIEQQWSENYLTTVGNLFHSRAHDEVFQELRGDTLTVRGLRISSSSLGISGQCDIVEFKRNLDSHVKLKKYEGTWDIFPVEYKSGKSKLIDADRYQVVAQAICLEEMFNCTISQGYLYYGKTHHREVVKINDYREFVIKCYDSMHKLLKVGRNTNASYSAKCKACSLFDICMPKIKKKTSLTEYFESMYKDDIK